MALPRLVKAVVFDMDGLLVDSEVVYCEALTAQAAAMGHELGLDVLKKMIGHTWAGSAVVLREHFGDQFDTDRLRDG
jgi:beta-phosphoglucomutase-like phosphatase (HAD superfamily)